MRAKITASLVVLAGVVVGLRAGQSDAAQVGEDSLDASGRPALVAAAAAGQPDRVRTLLRRGASPDGADRSGWTALHEAAQRGDLVTARVLLDAGATPDLRSRDRGTALDVAERASRPELARLLRARGARGSGKSKGDVVCVRPWQGDGYCGRIESLDATRAELRVTELVGCSRGCPPEAACSAGRTVGRGGLAPGDTLRVPLSCLTHTGVR